MELTNKANYDLLNDTHNSLLFEYGVYGYRSKRYLWSRRDSFGTYDWIVKVYSSLSDAKLDRDGIDIRVSILTPDVLTFRREILLQDVTGSIYLNDLRLLDEL